jgi:hypothetical protein
MVGFYYERGTPLRCRLRVLQWWNVTLVPLVNSDAVLARVATHVNSLLSLPDFPETFNPWMFGDDVTRAALESLNRDSSYSRGGLRLSKIGLEPILLGLDKLGIQTQNDVETSPLFVRFAGHLWEAFVRALLRTSTELTVVETDNKVSWNGVTGHFDILVETPKGRRVLLEVKHLSETYIRNVCVPERTYSEASGTDTLTGKYLPQLRYGVYEHDTRGYVTQASAYADSIPGCVGAILVLWNKQGNYPLASPITKDTSNFVLGRAREVLEALPNVETLHDLFQNFAVPDLVPQISRKVPTGRYYVPFPLRYLRTEVLDLLYVRDGLCPDLPYVAARTEPPNLLDIPESLWQKPTPGEATQPVKGHTPASVPTNR